VPELDCGSGSRRQNILDLAAAPHLAIAALKRGAAPRFAPTLIRSADRRARQRGRQPVAGRLVGSRWTRFLSVSATSCRKHSRQSAARAAPLLASSIKPGGQIVRAGCWKISRWKCWRLSAVVLIRAGRMTMAGRACRARLPPAAMINELKSRCADHRGTTAGRSSQQLAEGRLRCRHQSRAIVFHQQPSPTSDRVQAHGLRYVHIPVKWDAPSAKTCRNFCCDEALSERKVFVHCANEQARVRVIFLHRVLYQNMAPETRDATCCASGSPSVWTAFIERMLIDSSGISRY